MNMNERFREIKFTKEASDVKIVAQDFCSENVVA